MWEGTSAPNERREDQDLRFLKRIFTKHCQFWARCAIPGPEFETGTLSAKRPSGKANAGILFEKKTPSATSFGGRRGWHDEKMLDVRAHLAFRQFVTLAERQLLAAIRLAFISGASAPGGGVAASDRRTTSGSPS